MDEIFGRRDMIAPVKLKELSVKSDLHGFVQLGSHLGALVLSAAALLLTWGTFWAIPAFIPVVSQLSYRGLRRWADSLPNTCRRPSRQAGSCTRR